MSKILVVEDDITILGALEFTFLDEGVIPVYTTSPLGIKAYIGYRIIQCIALALAELIILAGFGVVTNCNIIVTTMISILLAPLIFLVLGIMGRNKIQGLTLLKLVGLVMMLPIIQVNKENKFDVIFKIIPTDFILNASFIDTKMHLGILYILEIIISIGLLLNYFHKKCIKEI